MKKLNFFSSVAFHIASIALRAAAALMLAYSAWAFTQCNGIISQAKASGQLVASGNEYDIVSFYMTNSLQFAAIALLLFGVGLVLVKPKREDGAAAPPSPKEKPDDDSDEWYTAPDN
ncbi:MAG: hypothetical protein LBC41_01675 [Clostridiales bacterium]|nr:hypothetical protein [Clostridiales bacterium]MDR2749344.1 hypothetical protein [Clostridiales bacterium]